MGKVMNSKRCSCGREIFFGRLVETDERGNEREKLIPLDLVAPCYVLDPEGRRGGAVKRAEAYVSHFVTCPLRERFSKKSSPKVKRDERPPIADSDDVEDRVL